MLLLVGYAVSALRHFHSDPLSGSVDKHSAVRTARNDQHGSLHGHIQRSRAQQAAW